MAADPEPDARADDREGDVGRDDAQALTRATGGEEQPDMPDSHSTTGSTPSEEFVGRDAGADVGYAGETGAERRAGSG